MHVIFSEKEQKRGKKYLKRAKYLKILGKCFEKGKAIVLLLHAINCWKRPCWFHIFVLGNDNLKHIFLVEYSFLWKKCWWNFILVAAISSVFKWKLLTHFWHNFISHFLIGFTRLILQVTFLEFRTYDTKFFKCVFNTHHYRIAKLHVNL